MNILFLGYVVEPATLDKYKEISIAGNKMQVNYLKQFSSFANVDAISIPPIAMFPKNRKIKLQKREFRVDKVNVIQIPILNIFPFKQLFQMSLVYKYARKMTKEKEYDYVVTFNSYEDTFFACKKLNKTKGIKIISIIADMPDNPRFFKSKILTFIYDRVSKKNVDNVYKSDYLIAINEEILRRFDSKGNNCVIYGGINDEEVIDFDYFEPNDKTIVYTGALTDYSGILELIGAVELMNSDVLLHIYGEGPLEEKVKSLCNDKIKYHGRVSNDEAIRAQINATILVNPRRLDDEISSFTFPSKMFEYINSNTPVVSTMLKCYPKDIVDSIYVVRESSSKDLANVIDYVLNLSFEQRKEKAYEAKKTLLNYRWSLQSNKIQEMLGKKI